MMRQQLTAATALLLVRASAAAAVMPPCDTDPHQATEICAAFCSNKCGFYNRTAGETGAVQNVTVFRITPRNVTGIRNKNTGDAIGDVNFFLSRKNLTLQCLQDPTSFGCFLDGDNVYQESIVEVDGQWGPYMECNPVSVGGDPRSMSGGWSDTQNFQCGQNCIHPTRKEGCSTTRRQNGSSQFGGGGLSCFCDGTNRDKKTVGREPKGGIGGYHGHSYAPKDWPVQCEQGFDAPYGRGGSCVTGTTYKTLHGWSFASSAAMACDGCSTDPKCSGWAISADNRTATLFQGPTKHALLKKCASATKARSHHNYPGSGGKSWFGVSAGSGYWYSTPLAGQCAEGKPVGTDGCTWRVVKTVKYANASCIDGKLDAAVESVGDACFSTCATPMNRTSECYLNCYYNTLVGDAAYNITKPKSLVQPWLAGFTSDSAPTGCPVVQTMPCKGPQCPEK